MAVHFIYMKRVLVTGANGFVGRHLVQHLFDQPYHKTNGHKLERYQIFATDLSPRPIDSVARLISMKRGVSYLPSDLRNPESLKPLFEEDELSKPIDTVYHPAALFNLCMNLDQLKEVNVEGTVNLISEAQQSGVRRVINWSSSSIYGCWEEDEKRNEEYPLKLEEMLNAYAKSKFLQEQAAQEFDNPDRIRVTSVRPANIYGIGTNMGIAFPLLAIHKKMMKRPAARLDEKGEPIYAAGSHVHVKDVIKAAYFLANDKRAAGEIYNLAEDKPISTVELFELGCYLIGRKMKEDYNTPKSLERGAKIFSALAGLRNGLVYALTFGQRKTKLYPLFDKESSQFMVNNHLIDNQKITDLGFKFEHNIRDSLREIVHHHQKTDWKEIKYFKREYV